MPTIMPLAATLLTIMLPFLAATPAIAGNLDAPAAPSDSGSAMYTLEDVYNRIDDGTAGTKRAGAFAEPAAAPGSTGHDLDDLYDLASERSRPAKTGQTTSSATGDDGEIQAGVVWPDPRFTDNGDGTVTDNLTGLIWLKNTNCFGTQPWTNALAKANALYDGCTDCGGADNDCGLVDSSTAGDWRLPNIKELQSLVDFGQDHPALPSGYPFLGVPTSIDQSYHVWSSTSRADLTASAWYLNLRVGDVNNIGKSNLKYVLPVRGGQ
ncbi:DUF1566 domain-containing protein [Thiohalocapsa marina]|uniref:Lcl C-terminal domain-containing protein n=1 Tax=Thiohalocapsa marina TaxID=424902 RepID=UPI0036DF7CCD